MDQKAGSFIDDDITIYYRTLPANCLEERHFLLENIFQENVLSEIDLYYIHTFLYLVIL